MSHWKRVGGAGDGHSVWGTCTLLLLSLTYTNGWKLAHLFYFTHDAETLWLLSDRAGFCVKSAGSRVFLQPALDRDDGLKHAALCGSVFKRERNFLKCDPSHSDCCVFALLYRSSVGSKSSCLFCLFCSFVFVAFLRSAPYFTTNCVAICVNTVNNSINFKNKNQLRARYEQHLVDD